MILLSPGPVYVPKAILKAQTQEMITHRSPEFSELYSNLVERMKKYLNAYDAHIITGSGSVGLESLISNIAKKEEKMVCLTNGVFGDKLGKTAQIYTDAIIHSLDAGKGWDLGKAKGLIDESNAQIFGMVYNETGYGVKNKVMEILKYAKKKGMFTIMDCISAWPGTALDMKEFELDGFVTGSQKGPGCPPGLALVGLSEEAVDRIKGREKVPTYYGDLRKYMNRYEKDKQTPFTPAISLMYALRESFDMLDKKDGMKGAVKRHRRLANYVRKQITELGFELIPEKGFESDTVTAFKGGNNAKEIRERLKKEFGVVIVGCKGEFAENGLRIAHMGWVTRKMIDSCLGGLKKIKGI